MASIQTGVPTSFVVPQTFHKFNYLRQSGSLVSVPLTVALIATKASSTGTAVLGTVYSADDAATVDALGGPSSEGAIMARQAFACSAFFGRGPTVKIVFVAEPAGGVANVQALTVTGTAATADGNQVIRIAGRNFQIGVRTGDIPATNAAAILAAFQGQQDSLPVIASAVGAVVSLTHPTKGVNGGRVKVEVVSQVAGLTVTLTTTTPGSGVSDITAALDALSPLRYSGIVTANTGAADIAAINADILTRWGLGSKTWGYYFLGDSTTIGTATPIAAAANHQAVIYSLWEGCPNAPGEIATASAMLVFSEEAANASYDGRVVPLFPPPDSQLFTGPERNTAIKAGLTVYEAVIDSTGTVTAGRGKCVQLVTTRSTTAAGFPDDRNRDIAMSRVGVEIATQLDFAQSEIAERNPAGVAQEDAQVGIIDLAASILRAEARARVISTRFVEEDVAALRVEADPTVLGRNNALIQYHPRLPQHQVAWAHNIIAGL